MTILDQINNTYALLKYADGFLSFERPSRFIRVTTHYIEDYITQTKTNFSKEALFELLNTKWQFQLLSYELGMLFEWDEVSGQEVELAIFIEFSDVTRIAPHDRNSLTTATPIDVISFEEYSKKFDETYEHLLAGNCYQLNLTSQLKFQIESVQILEDFFSSQACYAQLSEFAHLIRLAPIKRLIVSNSPECLFEYDRGPAKLTARPIKGTIRNEEGLEALRNDIKNESELNIITDLLRNDLSRIGPSFSEVEAMREFFEVPGLIHQFSRVSVTCPEFDNAKILKAIFPGGSITGAPKKRVLKLIESIEDASRGVYTGSTVVCYNDICKASINIRTLCVDTSKGSASYGSGGGITLLSSKRSEFHELLDKAYSFLKVFFKDVKF